jgi:hypothetical protein
MQKLMKVETKKGLMDDVERGFCVGKPYFNVPQLLIAATSGAWPHMPHPHQLAYGRGAYRKGADGAVVAPFPLNTAINHMAGMTTTLSSC